MSARRSTAPAGAEPMPPSARPRCASATMALTSPPKPRAPTMLTTAHHPAVSSVKTTSPVAGEKRESEGGGSRRRIAARISGGIAAATASRKRRTVGRSEPISGRPGLQVGSHHRRGDQPVADASFGEEVSRVVGVDLHLAAQSTHGDPYVGRIRSIRLRPDTFEQSLGWDRAIQGADHHLKDTHLRWGQRLGPGPAGDAAMDKIDLQLAAVEVDLAAARRCATHDAL